MPSRDLSLQASDETPDMTSGALCGKLFSDEVGQRVEFAPTWKFGILRRTYPLALFLLDALVISAIYVAVLYIRKTGMEGEAFRWGMVSKKALLVLLTGVVTGLALIGGYQYRAATNSARFVSEHIVASVFAAVVVVAAIYAFIAYGARVNSARSAVFTTLAIFPFLSIGYRYLLGRFKEKRQGRRAICVLGAGSMTVSHLNDSYFWVVAQFSQMDTATALRCHTLATLIQGLVGIATIALLAQFLL